MNDDFKIVKQSLLEWYPFDEKDCVALINKKDSYLDELVSKRCKLINMEDYDELLKASKNDNKLDVVILYDLYDFCIRNDVEVKDVILLLISMKNKNGKVFLAMENKLGMKYWAGCQEEQFGGYFVGIEDYEKWDNSIRPLSKKEIEDLIASIDGVNYKFYYPYPDYKLPTIIYTDECLPKEGELFRNVRNIDRDRYVILDERRAFDSVIKAGLFPEFSNSFLISIF